MTDIERLRLAEDEFMDAGCHWRSGESFHPAFNRYLAENYGVKYLWPCPLDDCIEVINSNLYTFFLLKWP